MTDSLIYEQNIAAPLTESHVDSAVHACRTQGVRVTRIELTKTVAQGLWDRLASAPRTLEPIKPPIPSPSFDSIPLLVSEDIPDDTLILLDADGNIVGRLVGIAA